MVSGLLLIEFKSFFLSKIDKQPFLTGFVTEGLFL